jgi:ATP/maltotriose-dependent transcriptional regulator MalT
VRVARGELNNALEHFARAEKIATEMQMRPALWQARIGASQVLRELGRTDEANAQRDGARETIGEIAGLFRDESLRAMYAENALKQVAT